MSRKAVLINILQVYTCSLNIKLSLKSYKRFLQKNRKYRTTESRWQKIAILIKIIQKSQIQNN